MMISGSVNKRDLMGSLTMFAAARGVSIKKQFVADSFALSFMLCLQHLKLKGSGFHSPFQIFTQLFNEQGGSGGGGS